MANSLIPTGGQSTSLKSLAFSNLGQLQSQRASTLLSQQNFSVEQRDFSDWIAYLRRIAQDIQFFDVEQQTAQGSWLSALPDHDQAKALQDLMAGKPVSSEVQQLAERADIASLMAFYQMLRYPMAQIQRFTQRHLSYYFEQVLGLKPKSATADRAHLVVTLDQSTETLTLTKGTQFEAGKDSEGNDLVYETLSNALFNQAQVKRLLSMSRLSEGGRLRLTDAVNVEAGLEMPESGIYSFGEKKEGTQTPTQNDEQAKEEQPKEKQGIEIASSCLFLSGGKRVVTLSFVQASETSELPISLSDLFYMSISTEEGPVPLTTDTEHVTVTWSGNQLTLTFEPLFPPITGIGQALPALQLELKPEWLDDTQIQRFREDILTQITLDIDVLSLPCELVGESGNILDGTAPFHPFGLAPRTASRFDFTHPELLCKSIDNAKVNFAWLDRPDDFEQYYFAYRVHKQQDLDYTNPENWSKYSPLGPFQVSVFYSDQQQAISLNNETHLFSDQVPQNNLDQHGFYFIEAAQQATVEYQALPLSEKQPRHWPKYFSLQLRQPDFGHLQYPQVNQYAAHLNNKHFNNENYQPLLVLPPYTPVLDKMTINYHCQANFDMAQDSVVEARPELGALSARHIHPLGRPKVPIVSGNFALLPKFEMGGYLYIGISDLSLPGQLRLYFQMDPVDNSNVQDNPAIDWHYLTDQGWQFFDASSAESARIVEDSTFKLLDSGVVTFEFPELPFSNNFIDPSCLWIRVSIAANSLTDDDDYARYSRIRGVYSQGIEVQLVSGNVAADHYTKPLPAETIGSLVEENKDVSEVLQPYPSFGAKQAQSQQEFYVSSSERLRHKNRALLAWDYERLVLAEFPELYLARCYSNTDAGITSVAIVVVPINHNPGILQPKVPLYLKRQIQQFVNKVSPDGVLVKVLDPIYEEVQISIYAQILPEFDKERVEGELNELLIRAMTPWDPANADTIMQADVKLTQLTQQLEQHPALQSLYVMRAKQKIQVKIDEEIKDETLHYPDTSVSNDVEKFQRDNIIKASKPEAILVPAKIHDITLFNHYQPIFEGIGKWRLELDFKVR